MLRETKEQTLSVRVTRLADWLLRIHARYEPMNGFTESAGLLHELLAKTESLEAEVAILRKAQEPLGAKFEKVLSDNLWEMLEEDGKAGEK